MSDITLDLINSIEKYLKETLQKDPNNAETLHMLGICAARKDDLIDAYEFMQKAATFNLNTSEFHNNFGNVYHKLNKIEEALNHYQKALEIDFNYAFTYNNIGNIYLKQENLAKAQEYFEIATKINPNFNDAHYNLAIIFTKKNLKKAALEQLDIILNFDPQHALAHHKKAQLCYQEDDLTSALNHYQKYLELEPNDKDALYNLGTIFLRIGNPQEATKYFLRFVALKADYENFYNLGVAYLQQGKNTEAITYFEESLRLNPDHIPALTNLATAYLNLADYPNAIKYFSQINKLQPENIENNFILSAISQTNKSFETAPSGYVKELFNQYAPHYEKHLSLLNCKVPELLFNAINNISHTITNLTILDLGCGTGLAGELFRPLAKKLIGIDLAEKMLSQAQQKNIYDELLLADINDSIKNFSELDIVIAAEILVYVGNLDKIFSQLKTALKTDGLFGFTIEKTSKYPYELQKTARFSHAKEYLKELIDKYHFEILLCQNIILRRHLNEQLEGELYIIRSKLV